MINTLREYLVPFLLSIIAACMIWALVLISINGETIKDTNEKVVLLKQEMDQRALNRYTKEDAAKDKEELTKKIDALKK